MVAFHGSCCTILYTHTRSTILVDIRSRQKIAKRTHMTIRVKAALSPLYLSCCKRRTCDAPGKDKGEDYDSAGNILDSNMYQSSIYITQYLTDYENILDTRKTHVQQ